MDSLRISHEPRSRDLPPPASAPDEVASPDRFEISFRGVFHCPEGSRDLFLRRLADCIGCGLPPPAMPSGRFAIAIRDRTTGVLYLVTDWLGSEPLYYTRSGKFWRWAFDLTRLAVLAAPRQLDPRAMDEFFTYHWINEERSPIEGIHRVLPGRVVRLGPWEAPMELVHTRKTYTLDNHVDSLADATARTSAALDRYFSGLGLQHERIGVLLSGGVDSSLLLARSRLHFKRPLAITAEFVGYPNPELDRAREVAKILGVEHQVVQIEPQYLHDQLRRLTRIMETPVTYINNFVRLALFDRLSGQVPMVLSGEGADGMFGSEVGRAGEIDRLRSRRALFDKLPGPARAALFHLHGAVRPGFGVFEPEFKRAVRRIGEAFREPYINVPPLRAIREQRSGYFYDYLERDQDDLQKIRRDRGLFTQNRHQYYCYARLAVATGVAVDCPFLADALVDIGLALPLEHRSNASGAKPILRNLLLQDLPAEIVNASKLGFHTPSEQWINGPLAADLAMLQDDVTRRRGLYDLEAVARERDTHTLWALLTFEVFCREFIDSCG